MGSLNSRLREMRKYLRVSQSEFGETGGVSQSTQNRYEQTDADIPISYLDKIFKEYGSDFNENWFYFGKGEMLAASKSLTNESKTPSLPNFANLTPQEAQILSEVTQFSDFLKNRPLRPEVKRRLLELLIESIDEALDELHDETVSKKP
ncbi:helix-turn-helix domain-containing protein [Rhodohalobacter sp. 614A]|uniref:helix-turn-helix domain-containing protein n=1 Tax=Rhodohalobacter sp. 614A TaxID=2908649 RepID=UPI001F3D3FAC|nr:helix-turn-helix transcriptional regulator [Rhodohalobacter sp. 614A]